VCQDQCPKLANEVRPMVQTIGLYRYTRRLLSFTACYALHMDNVLMSLLVIPEEDMGSGLKAHPFLGP
jgi:hypothetical protein